MVVTRDCELSEKGNEHSLGRDRNMAAVAGDSRHHSGSKNEKRGSSNEDTGAVGRCHSGVGLLETSSGVADESEPFAGASTARSRGVGEFSKWLCKCAHLVPGQERRAETRPQQN